MGISRGLLWDFLWGFLVFQKLCLQTTRLLQGLQRGTRLGEQLHTGLATPGREGGRGARGHLPPHGLQI